MIRGTAQPTKAYLVPGDVHACLDELDIEVVKILNGEAWALCPSKEHDNVRPDKWSVNLETGQHSCFSCGFAGSFTRIVREVKGYDYSDAATWVRSRGGLERLRRALEAPTYDYQAEAQPALRDFNESRLALYVDPPASARGTRGISAGSVEEYGVLWDDVNDYWILPIRDPDSFELWGYQEKGKDWFSNRPYGVVKSNTLFGIDCFTGGIAIVQESPLDCLRIRTAEIFGAVSTFGVKISDAQFELLFDIADTVMFGLDNDDAGIAMSLEIKRRFRRSGKDIRFLNYSHIPNAKDMTSAGVTDSDIRKAVQTATNLVTYNP